MKDPATTGAKFERLVEIMATLRGPNGCPWDREQDLDSLRPMLIEEVYEVIEAVDERDFPGLAEELGDVLLHVVFHARLAEEEKRFRIDQVLDGIAQKLVRRHPHVFGTASAANSDEVLESWEAIKKKEKADAGRATPESVLDGVGSNMPGLHEAHKISARVARLGFEWPDVDAVLEKVDEELSELRSAIEKRLAASTEDARADVEEELGDLFFTLVNVARHMDLDSESALKRANRKFRRRWRQVEQALEADAVDLDSVSTERLEAEWTRAKATEPGR